MNRKKPQPRSTLRITKSAHDLFHVWWKIGDGEETGFSFSRESECRFFIQGFQTAVTALKNQACFDCPEVVNETEHEA